MLRRTLPLENSAEQLTLFTLDRYGYHAMVSDPELSPYSLFQFYNGRTALERIIRMLEDDYPFGSAPTASFDANAFYAELSMLAYDLIVWFRQLCLPKDWQSFTLSTIRHRLLMIPGALVKTDNIPTLRFPHNCLYPRRSRKETQFCSRDWAQYWRAPTIDVVPSKSWRQVAWAVDRIVKPLPPKAVAEGQALRSRQLA